MNAFASSPASARPPLTWAVPLAILAFAAVLRLAGLDKSLWMDEAGSYAQASAVDFLAMARNYDHPPLYFAVLRGGLALTDSIATLRLFSVVCGLATVALFCFWPLVETSAAGWCAGLIVATSPAFILHSQELRQYALLFLALAASLACGWRLALRPTCTGPRVGLAVALTVATATHLLTAFFIAALALVLLFVLRTQERRTLAFAAAAFVPATLLALYLKTIFLTQTIKTPDQWWMPPLSPGLLRGVFSDATGWSALLRFADACNRHLSGSGAVVVGLATMGGAYLGWTAWARRSAGSAHALLAVATIYWSLLVVYSLFIVPLIWTRTILPGMLPLVLGLALGLASHPSVARRRSAFAVVAMLAIATTVPWLRGLAWESREDLRGLTLTLRRNWGPADALVFVGGCEWGVLPYWPDYEMHHPLKIDILQPAAVALAPLATAVSKNKSTAATLLIYREDLYLAPRRALLDTIVRTLSAGREATELWDRNGYHIVRFADERGAHD